MVANCFTSTSTGRTYSITQILSCKSKNVIYLVTSKKCNGQYVGSTSNDFKTTSPLSRITKKRACEVVIHFNKEPHVLADFGCLIIEQLVSSIIVLMIVCSQERLLYTLKPLGLYKRCEFNSKNRIRYSEHHLVAVFYLLLADVSLFLLRNSYVILYKIIALFSLLAIVS